MPSAYRPITFTDLETRNYMSTPVGAQPKTGIMEQEGPIFSGTGWDAIKAGFAEENSPLALWQIFTGSAQDQRIEQALVDFRGPDLEEAGQWHVPEENIFEDVRFTAAPSHYWKHLIQANNREELGVILNILQEIDEERAETMEKSPISFMLGAMGGSVASPGGAVALAARSAKTLGLATTLMAYDEAVLHDSQPTRTFEYSKNSVLLGATTTAAFITAQKVLSAIYPRNRPPAPETVVNFLEETEKRIVDYRKHGPSRNNPEGPILEGDAVDITTRFGTMPKARTTVDELPFGKGAKKGDEEPGTLRLNPEDDLDAFDPLKQSSTVFSSGRFEIPKIGSTEGDKLVPALKLEAIPDNPTKRILQGSSDIARGLIGHLVEHPFWTMKNLGGVENAVGVDRLVLANWMGQRVYPLQRETDSLYAVYRTRVAGSAQKTVTRQIAVDAIKGRPKGVLSPGQFYEEVGKAKRRLNTNDDLSMIPEEAVKAAKAWDDILYKPLGKAAKEERMFSIRERSTLRRKQSELKSRTDELSNARRAGVALPVKAEKKLLDDISEAKKRFQI